MKEWTQILLYFGKDLVRLLEEAGNQETCQQGLLASTAKSRLSISWNSSSDISGSSFQHFFKMDLYLYFKYHILIVLLLLILVLTADWAPCGDGCQRRGGHWGGAAGRFQSKPVISSLNFDRNCKKPQLLSLCTTICSEACRLTYLEEELPLVFLITFLLLLLSVPLVFGNHLHKEPSQQWRRGWEGEELSKCDLTSTTCPDVPCTASRGPWGQNENPKMLSFGNQ